MRAVALAIVLASARASANPFEVEGLTSRYAAMANTGVASADDAAALYYNPAGLVLVPGSDFELGTVGADAHLNHAGKLPDPLGVQLAVRAPLPLRGVLAGRLVVGIALHLLPRDVAHVIAPAPEQIYYPYYGDRLSRIVVLPGIAAHFDRVAIGAAVDVLAGLTGDLSGSDAGVTRALDPRADERIPTVARALVGASWQVTPSLRVGAVFRQRFELPIATRITTMIAGEPVDLDIAVHGQFAPHQLVGGAAYTRGRTTLSGELRYARWSDYRGPFVVVSSTLPLVGDVPALSPRVPFSDTIGARGGIETQLGAWTARAGYGYETSPVPAKQAGVTNLLDGPRHTIAAGGGRRFGRLRIDAHVQMQLLQARVIEKQLFDKLGAYDPFTSLRDEDPQTDGLQITNPGFPKVTASGQVFAAGITLAVPL
jgi:hypothetical protein